MDRFLYLFEGGYMPKELIVSATSLETKVAILEDGQVTEIFIERDQSRSILGNVYKGRVMRVLPGMQAAFVDIGLERNAFLYVSDFFEDYDEYDDLFNGTPRAHDEYIDEFAEPEPKITRKQRKQKKTTQPVERPSQQKKVLQPQSNPDPVLPPAPVIEPIEFRILPDFLPGVRASSGDESDYDRDFAFDRVQILPDKLNPVNETTRKRSFNRRKTKRSQVETKPDVQHFAVNQNGRSRNNKRGHRSSVPLIGDLLKEGQEILVQVAKEPIAKKGARITSHVVFPGRYLVFMPTVDHVGVSRRIESAKERQRLREIVLELRGEFEKGFIVRTAGEGKTKEDFRQDMVYLTRLWESIRSKVEESKAPCLIHTELDLVQRVVRDFFSDEYRTIRVDDEVQYERLAEFISNFNPKLVPKLRLYTKKNPIFSEYNIDTEIERSLKSKVWLRNGGYIVINQTEALVAIDVNTGKFVGKTNSLEDTIAKTNLDAVRETVRQIRLRDLGGIIVVDFIDMTETKNQNRVLEALQNELKKDKSPSKVLPFNEFGLVAITRKRVKQSLERAVCQPCIYCDGTGMTKSVRTIVYSIHDEVRRTLPALGEGRELIIRCHPEIVRALEGIEKSVTREIEEISGKEVTFRPDSLMHIEQFDLVEA
jgi:Rne/Rng family ribonuclease